jgi:phenylpropionate dioxygenase-like ring-hydroxylating dioxygenase large terminal subunit
MPSSPLPKDLYSNPAALEAERQRIFFRTWQFAAHTSQLRTPGDFVCLEIADQSVFVIRGQDGALRAFYNVCQHRAHGLLQGAGNTKSTIVCGYHAWTYGCDGKLKSARHCAGQEGFEGADFGLEPVRVDVALGFVFVNLDWDAATLHETAGDMFEDIERHVPYWDSVAVSPDFETDGPDLAANWKVLAENCLECYHCGPAHPAFCDLIDMDSYDCAVHDTWLRSYGELGKAQGKAYAVGPDEPSRKAIYWHLWPNTELIVYPGEAAMTTFRFNPKAPGQTGTSSLMLLQPGDSIAPERLNYRWNVLWPEDEALCKSVHAGLQSRGFRGGHLVINEGEHAVSEHGVAAFQGFYRKAMDGASTEQPAK